MARVTVAQVQEIYPTSKDLTPFIETAHLLVNEELASSGMTNDRMAMVEKYLAAHFAIISLEKGGITRQKIGESEDYYQTWQNSSVGLMASRFGQQAAMLDSSGTLASAASGKLKAQFTVVGNNPADEVDEY